MQDDLAARRPWRTRGELLAARAEAVPRLEKRLLSLRRFAGQIACVCVLTLTWLLAASAADQGDGAAVVVTAVVVGLGALACAVRPALTTRSLMAELLDWEEVERTGRSLPPGDINPEHRTLFDLPGDDDHDAAAHRATVAAVRRAAPRKLRFRAAISGIGAGVGLVLLLVGVLTDGGALAAGAAITGVVVLAMCLTAAVAASRYSLRMRAVAIQLIRDSGVPAAQTGA